MKKLWRKLQAGAELTEEKTTNTGFVTATHQCCAKSSSHPRSRENCFCAKASTLSQAFISSHHFSTQWSLAHKWPLLLILWNYLTQKSAWSNGSNNDNERALLVSEEREYNTDCAMKQMFWDAGTKERQLKSDSSKYWNWEQFVN